MALRVAARVPWGLHRSILSGRGHDGTHPGDPLPPRVRPTFRISLGSALEVDCAPGETADTGIPTESPSGLGGRRDTTRPAGPRCPRRPECFSARDPMDRPW